LRTRTRARRRIIVAIGAMGTVGAMGTIGSAG